MQASSDNVVSPHTNLHPLLMSLLLVQTHEGDMRLVSVYVPTNHVYVGE